MLRLVQSIYNGFERDEATAVIFIDLKGAYDTIWREGLVYKLHKSGVQGKLLGWINNFLQNRSARCILDQTTGPTFTTSIGLPQGSVLSPILFNTFIIDMYKAVMSKVKFADDGTVWFSAISVYTAVQVACSEAQKIKTWCRLWRLLVSLNKTEGSLFSRIPLPIKPKFELDGATLPYNSTPKILGINLDEQLTFEEHVNVVTKKATGSLRVIREVKGIAKVSTSKLVQLYTTLVRSIMDYGSVIWQGSKYTNRLAAVQRKALSLCLGLPSTAGTDVAEVAAGIPPIDLHLTENAIRELAKIQAKSTTRPVKALLNSMNQTELTQSTTRLVISPLRLALTQAKEMEKTTGIDIQMIEPEPEYEEGCVAMTSSAPKYWSRLGSSKSRTTEQQEMGKELVMDMMMEAPEGTAFAFTDGSCLTNPGPCGAGAAIYTDHHQPVHLKRPVTRRGSILLGELVAILITLEYVLENIANIPCRLLKIFSDSQSTVGILTLNWKDTSYREVTQDIRKTINHLQQRNIVVEIDWTPGHSSIAGNDVADGLAKEAALEASKFPEERRTTSHPEIKLACRQYISSQWQRRWEQSDTGRDFYSYCPKVDFKRLFDQPSKEAYSWILQLQTGYTLNSYRYKLGQVTSDMCSCGQTETVEHFLLHCPLHEQARNNMELKLSRSTGLYHLDLHDLLGNEEDDNIPDYRENIRLELTQYIRATGRFQPSPRAPQNP